MRVLVSGASGLVGRALCPALQARGGEVVRLVRNSTRIPEGAVSWDPDHGTLPLEGLSGVDAVVHLAGESIASGRWSEARKERIRGSRMNGTRLLAKRIAELPAPPKVLVSASAIGVYGDTGDQAVNEDSRTGSGFLAEVCRAWEEATQPASEAGVRVIHLRIGLVLSGSGGALATMLLPFKLGLGGPLGDGRMWMSWIHIDDLVRVILFAIDTPALTGPVNALSPDPVTNREFSRTLGRVLGRPAVLPVPAFVLRLLLGEMADGLLLSSVRAHPGRLEEAGFQFHQPALEGALRSLLCGGSPT